MRLKHFTQVTFAARALPYMMVELLFLKQEFHRDWVCSVIIIFFTN